jgi:hypothetical protein
MQIPRHNVSYPVLAIFHHDCPLAVKTASTPWCLLPKQTWRDSLPTHMLLSAVSILVVALPSLEILEGLMNYSVYSRCNFIMYAEPLCASIAGKLYVWTMCVFHIICILSLRVFLCVICIALSSDGYVFIKWSCRVKVEE